MLNIKKDFPWFSNNKNIIYLDSAATTHKTNTVINAITDYLINQSTNPHNDDSIFCHKATQVIRECRKISAELVNADEEEILFTSGATESLNLIANSISDLIQKDDEIVITDFEHGSNILPWFNLRDNKNAKIVFATGKKLELTPQDFLDVLTPKTKIVSFTGTSNILGQHFDVAEISKAIKEYNSKILICVDVAQMLPHHKCDFHNWDIDFAAYSGHKIMGPTGIGVCYIKKILQNKIKPLKLGGGMNASIDHNGYVYMDGTHKFEGGTPNVSGIYGLYEATKYLLKIGYDNIAKHEEEIFNILYKELKNCKHIEVYNWESKSSILAFNIKGVFCQDTATFLGNNNIIVRSGLSCAKLIPNVINQFGIVRASFFIYNTKEDVEKFISFLKSIDKEKILNELI